MAHDYEKIRKDNIEEYGKGTRHLAYFSRLYSMRTHFLFEVLQNAEDAIGLRRTTGPNTVRFVLHPDRLEVRHFGKPFDEKDVRGVCGIDEGTKTNTNGEEISSPPLGKFGIGFKSVYGYTCSPRIYSGGERFRIERFVEPHGISDGDEVPSPAGLKTGETCLTLPFNRHGAGIERPIQPSKAVAEIADALKALSIRTLLFLKHIQEIQWESGGLTGHLQRVARPIKNVPDARRVEVSDGQNEESWIVFSRDSKVSDRQGRLIPVEVAFLLNKDKVAAAEDTELVVAFPTEKKTGLGFLIQGRFMTTPARDNLDQDCEENTELLETVAKLAAESLETLRDLGMLSVASYQALPLDKDNFPESSMFRVFHDQILDALKTKRILPKDGENLSKPNEFALADEVYFGSKDLRDLLSHEQLTALMGKVSFWLPGIDNVVRALGIKRISDDEFAGRISKEFLADQAHEWMANFYGFLAGKEALWREGTPYLAAGILRSKTIIRLQHKEHVAPFDGQRNPLAWLPRESGHDDDIPTVNRQILAADSGRGLAMKFLKDGLKLKEPDAAVAVVEKTLPKYKAPPILCDDGYEKDMEQLFHALDIAVSSRDSIDLLKKKAAQAYIAKARKAGTDEIDFRKPEDVYFWSADMEAYWEGNPNGWLLCDEEHAEEWKALGVSVELRLIPQPDLTTALDYSRWHGVSRIWNSTNYTLYGLESFFQNTARDARVLWRLLGKFAPEKFQATCSYNEPGRGKGRTTLRKSFDADFTYLLKTTPWLRNNKGEFARPTDIHRDELHLDFEPNEKLFNALAFKPEKAVIHANQDSTLRQRKQLLKTEAQALGMAIFSSEEEREYQALKNKESAASKKIQFPERPIKNQDHLDRRAKKMHERHDGAPGKNYDRKTRSVRRPAASHKEKEPYLRSAYVNDDGQMVCQLCADEMPFRRKDAMHYFEAVEFSGSNGCEDGEFFLALCPVCAAKYKVFVKNDPGAMQKLENIVASADPQEDTAFPIQLGNESATLRFVATHLSDIQTILDSEAVQ